MGGWIWTAALLACVSASPPAAANGRHEAPAPPPAVQPRAPHAAAVDWARKPTSEDLAWAYPKDAARKGLAGKAVIGCVVADDGSLADCKVVTETPPGAGFGEAALKVAPSFRMRINPDAPNVGPRRVRIPINFRMTEDTGGPVFNPKEVEALRDAVRPPVFGALGLPLAAMLIWWLAALVTRRGRDDDMGAATAVSVRNPHEPAWAKAARYGDIYPRTYRAEGFMGGGRGVLALLSLLVAGACLGPAAVAAVKPDGSAHWAVWTLGGVMLLVAGHAVWRLAVLFRAFVVLEAGAIDYQGLTSRRRLLRQEIAGYRHQRIGPGPLLIRLDTIDTDEPPLRVPVLWRTDAVFDHWFDGLTDRGARRDGI